MSYLKTIAILDLPVKKIENKRLNPCTLQLVGLPLPFKNRHYCACCFFVVVKALNFKTTTILVQLILNGKGSNWSTWVESCLHFFLSGQTNIADCF